MSRNCEWKLVVGVLRLTAVFLVVNMAQLAQGRVLVSVQSGGWTTASTWSPAFAPAAGDTIIISDGHTVTISNNLSYTGTPLHIEVFGTWRFNGGGAKISLPCNSLIFIPEGGNVISTGNGSSGNSQTISICSSVYWNGAANPTVSGPMGWPYNPLPVELLDFDATSDGDGVELNWATATELNSAHFEVQRSGDMFEWMEVGKVTAAGHSQQVLHYRIQDLAVPKGTWYYRLVQVDLDGTQTAFNVVPVRVLAGPATLRCAVDGYGLLLLRSSANDLTQMEPRLLDLALGREMRVHISQRSDAELTLELPDLAAGVHVLQMTGNGRSEVCRFVLAK